MSVLSREEEGAISEDCQKSQRKEVASEQGLHTHGGKGESGQTGHE